jgi:hypothetical protein
MFGGASTDSFFGPGESFCSQDDEISLKFMRAI